MRSVVAALGRRVLGNPIDYVQSMKGVTDTAYPGPRRREPPASAPQDDRWQSPDHGDWVQFVTSG